MNLKRIADSSPLFGAFLIFLGYLKLYWYYSNWNINIAQHLDFSEIILTFLNDTHFIMLYIIILILNFIIGITTNNSIGKINAPMIDSTDTSNHIVHSEHNNQSFSSIIAFYHERPILIITFTCFLIAVFGTLFWYTMKITWLYFTFFFITQLIFHLFEKIAEFIEEKAILPTVFVVIMFGITYCLSEYDANKTINYDKQSVFLTNYGEKIITNKDIKFLGKTNNYYYFYDISKKQSTIIQESVILKSTTTYFE